MKTTQSHERGEARGKGPRRSMQSFLSLICEYLPRLERVFLTHTSSSPSVLRVWFQDNTIPANSQTPPQPGSEVPQSVFPLGEFDAC